MPLHPRFTPVDDNENVITGGGTSSGSPGFVQIQDGTTTRLAVVTAANAQKVDGSAVTQPVSGTFWQATQPVSGTVTANAGSGTFTVSVSNTPSVTLSGTAQVTTSGTTTTTVSAGVGTDTVVKASAGRLCRVLITSTAGAAVTAFYDNASAGSGTIIGIFPAAVAAGTVGDFEIPAASGITLKGAVTNPAMTISFT